MKKNYTLLLLFSIFINLSNAQETISFLGYDGSGLSVTATTSTVNDDITIVFEDTNLIDNFYTDFQDQIYMYGGLDTSAGPWQDAPDFSDLNSQPILTLIDTDNNAAPNTYSITINLAEHYDGVPEGTIVYGFNLLFQNQYGGGGNNQTENLYIDLVDAGTTLRLDKNDKDSTKLYVSNSNLHISGYNGNAELQVYNVLGQNVLNKVIQVSNSHNSFPLELKNNALYIIKLKTDTFSKTIKTVL